MVRVVITGIGVICPAGGSTEEFWNNCLSGSAAVTAIPEEWALYSTFSSTIWAPLPPIDFLKSRLSRIELMQNDTTALLAVAASDQALAMSGTVAKMVNEKKNTYALEAIDPLRAGVFMGTGIGGIASFAANEGHQLYAPVSAALRSNPGGDTASFDAIHRLLRYPPRFHPFAVAMSMPNTSSATLGIKYSLNGPNLTVCNACCAGATAIGYALKAIRNSEIDWALAGGVEYLRDGYGGIFKGFDIAKTLVNPGADPASANRPFDTARSGFLFAEGGAAVLVLESLDHAQKRNAQPLAEILSYAESFDAHSIMSPDPSGTQSERTVRKALDEAGMTPENIDYINAHGTATPANDEIEARLIERVFPHGPLVNATKSLTGHAIGASGAIETAVTALSLCTQTVHGCKNLINPVRPLRFVQKSGAYPIQTALTQSFAFGGHSAALILSRC